MSRIYRGMAVEALAGLISQHLVDHGIVAVLSGGAVVSIYSANEYESADLDFVTHAGLRQLEPVMLELGFQKTERHFSHPDCDYLVEFPPAPVMIGNRRIEDWLERNTFNGRLRMLTPTQCVMDRLAAFYHWGDRQCLDQALLVAARHEIQFDDLSEWSAGEGHVERYREFEMALQHRKRVGASAPTSS